MMIYADPHPPLEFETEAHPQASVIFLHGLGASGRIFEPVARSLDLQALGAIRVVLPHAPIQPVLWAGGRRLPAWYDLRSPNFVEQEDEIGLRAGQGYYESLIRREIDRGIRPDRIVIGGFSQGCALSLMTGVRFAERLGGIFGMSGYLPLASATVAEQHQVNRKTPIFLAHGEQDSIVLAELAVAARDLLKKQGHEVSWNTYPIGHSICDAELGDLGAWIKRILAA